MPSTKNLCLIWMVICLSLSIYFIVRAFPGSTVNWQQIICSFQHVCLPHLVAGLIFLLLSYIMADISNRNPPQNQNILGALRMYAFYQTTSIVGKLAKRKLLRDCDRIQNSQSTLLTNVLKHVQNTAYVQERNLAEVKTVEEFRAKHPLTDYHYYTPWINRILLGEHNVLIPEQINYVTVTSGTTSGKSKLIPKNKDLYQRKMSAYAAYFGTILQMPHTQNLKYILDFRFRTNVSSIGCGIPRGPATMMRITEFKYVAHIPFISKQISNLNTAIYVNLVFSLKERDIGILFFPFGSHCYAFFRYMEDNWTGICDDIRRGRLNDSTIIKEKGVLDTLNDALYPDSQRADELEVMFKAGFEGIVPRVWPSASLICAIFTGSFAVYRRLIQQLYAGNVPIRCNPHMASESVYGVNIWPSMDRVEEFMLFHQEHFFEFIHDENISVDQPPTLLLHELELGQRYEIVITTDEGMYRYRTNDVIMITGFEGQIPTYKFAQRADDNLCVFAEKTPMCVMSGVVEECFTSWTGINLVEYAVTESANVNLITGGKDMRYVLLVETVGNNITPDQIKEMDERLQSASYTYQWYRYHGQIDEMHVVRLRHGAFDDLRKHLLACNEDASAYQVKIPRRPTKEEHLRLLLAI